MTEELLRWVSVEARVVALAERLGQDEATTRSAVVSALLAWSPRALARLLGS